MASSNIGVIHPEMPKPRISVFVSQTFQCIISLSTFQSSHHIAKAFELKERKKKMCTVRMGCFYRRWGMFYCLHGTALSIVDTFSMSLPL